MATAIKRPLAALTSLLASTIIDDETSLAVMKEKGTSDLFRIGHPNGARRRESRKSWNYTFSERTMAYLDLHGSAVSHGDQDALNVVLAGELKEVDLSWNVQLGDFEYYDRVGWPIERESLRVRKAATE
jgi:lipopolysaccharide biosynthesis glycosyltransferase